MSIDTHPVEHYVRIINLGQDKRHLFDRFK